ncbi:MAG: hypothetical protein JF609_01720, partial [Verrucomicrobia bacterium]|nr:hypothetical protein [Verrucomicrobiota bacterium]
MKTPSGQTKIKFSPPKFLKNAACRYLMAVPLVVAPCAFAASQTWTNAPVDATWGNTNNWVGKAVPGANNSTGNGANGDVVTFNAPLPISGIGGAGNPIQPDDATLPGDRSRAVLGITYDTTNCGAYVIYSPSPAVTPSAGVTGSGILYVGHNGALRINPTVTNSQTILEPMYVLLPSSTAGVFNSINNSTNPNAQLIISSLTHGGATSRGTTFVLDGTNTAPNICSNLSEGVSVGGPGNGGGITKQGTCTWILTGPNTFIGNSVIAVNGGTLIVQDAAAFGLANAANISVSNSVLRIDNVTLNNAGMFLRNGGTIRMNGSGTVNGVTVGNTTGTSVTLATTSASDVMTVGNAPNKMTGGTGDTVTHITGPGTVLLSQSANYIGRWSVDSGTNQVQDPLALGTGGNITVNIGTVFDTTLLGASTYSLTTKAITANGTGTVVGSTASAIMADPAGTVDLGSRSINLTYTPTTTNGDLTHPALYMAQGTMQCGGNAVTINNASGTPLNVGTYRLIHQASGSIVASGTFATFVTGSGLAAGLVGEVIASGSDINLTVYPYVPLNLVWTGADPLLPGQWDRQISTNWLAGATPSIFNIYDIVTFNATGSSQPNVTLVGTVE